MCIMGLSVGVKVKEGKGERGDPFALAIGRKRGTRLLSHPDGLLSFFPLLLLLFVERGGSWTWRASQACCRTLPILVVCCRLGSGIWLLSLVVC